MTEQNKDIYQRITDQIVAAIERGADEWRMPWHSRGGQGTARPINVVSRRAYRGVNVIALWAAAQEANYPTGIWATYRQWTELGAQVRKGERGCLVVFWKVYNRDEADQDGDATPDDEGGGSKRRRFFARGYTVFNASQVDGFAVAAALEPPVVERNMGAERFLDALDITTVFGGDRAFYHPSTDSIHLPPFEMPRMG
jgi:antirestriction protein ArdC